MNIKNFYPTPKGLIQKMLKDIEEFVSLKILEPSAGKGDIVDYILENSTKRNWNRDIDKTVKNNIDCIEIEYELQSVLKGKGYRVVHDDFLTFNTYKKYDYIIMNPPFDNGDKHLLKALEMQKNGGNIICLLNAETLNNLYSNTRKELDLKLKELNAKIEYLQEEFTTDDTFRKTRVEIVLIKIKIPNKQEDSNILINLKQATYKTINDEEIKNQIINGDFIEGLLQQYNFEVQAGVKLIDEYYSIIKLFPKTFDKTEVYNNGNILKLIINDGSNNHNYIESNNLYNDFSEWVRNKYWKLLFESKEIISISTNKLRENYYNKLNELKNYEFSLYNINVIKGEMTKHLYSSIEDTILELFDEFSFQSSYDNEFSKNIHYYNGWKTNKSWYVNSKVILRLDGYCQYTGRFDLSWKVREKLDDIIKVFNYLDNNYKYDYDLPSVLKRAEKSYQTKDIDCKYFTCDFFKKGTTHIKFKDETLLKKLNLFGSQKKGWLPPSFAKKNYYEMDKEEKDVIDGFCGESEYQEILENQDKYIYNVQNIKLIA